MFFIFSLLLLIPLLLIISFLCCQIILGLYVFSSEKTYKPLKGDRKPVTILIPAHNESLIIKETLTHLMKQILPCDKVIVIADNCEDDTAKIAEEFNIEVINRYSKENLGKGYALDFGIQHIKHRKNEVIIFLDADCKLQDNAIDQMSIAVNKYKCPVQALYIMQNTEQSNLSQKIAQFAFLIKNQVRPLGLKKLHLACQLMGTGMAFPWNLIYQTNLANGNIVEDMKLGIDLTSKGHNILFLPSAKVISEFPTDPTAQASQRTRWEHGHLDTIKTHVPNLLKLSLKTRNLKCLLFALDLAIPPITLLLIIIKFLILVFLSILLFSNDGFYLKLTSPFFISLFLCILLSWYTTSRNLFTASDIKALPKHILTKSRNLTNFLIKKEKKWVKTKRIKKQ